MDKGLVIYQGKNGEIELNLDAKQDTIWATQAQIVDLFGINVSTVSRHIRNVFSDGEVDAKSNLQKVQIANSDKAVMRYSLDVILAVGYRTNSQSAIKFRQWASKILKQYTIEGAVVNQRRLSELDAEKLKKIEGMLAVVNRLVASSDLAADEATGLLDLLSRYSSSWKMLEQYDTGTITFPKKGKKPTFHFTPEYCEAAIAKMKKTIKASDLFGKPRNDSFKGIIATLYQTFDQKELYQTTTEKAANLLYLIIKDHPFFDGNKRIGAFLFITFLTMNNVYLTEAGECKINDRALVALALLIAESEPREKPLIIALVGRLLS